MILLSLGLPGRLSEWCDAALTILARRLPGDVFLSVWPALDDIFTRTERGTALSEAALGLLRSGASHVVLGARQPDEGLRNVLAEARTWFVLALDDPRNATADVIAATDAPLASVVAAIASSCPLLARFHAMPGAVTVRRDDDPARVVAEMAARLELEISESDIASVLDELRSLDPEPLFGDEVEWQNRIPEAEHKLVNGALGAYADALPAGKLGQIVWGRKLFLSDGVPNSGVDGLIKLAGPPRHIVFGPYIRLPQGSWNARLVLGVSPEVVGQHLTIDFYAGSQLAATVLRPTQGGIYSIELNFTVMEPVSDRAELRIQVLLSASRGEVAFGHVVLTHVRTPQEDVFSQLEGDFKAVLAI